MKTPESILRDECPTDGMEAAIQNFTAPHPQPLFLGRQEGARRWPAAAGILTVLVVGTLALRLTITRAEAAPLSRVVQAEDAASRVEVRYSGPDGRIWGHAWVDGKRARFDQNPEQAFGFSVATNGRRFWSLSRDARTAMVMDGLPRLVAPYVLKVSEMGGNVLASKHRDDGGSQYLLERLHDPTVGRGRYEVVTDASDRPIEVRRLRLRGSKWEVFEVEKRLYDASIPAATFDFRPPEGYEVYDVDVNRARLLDGLRHGPVGIVAGISVRLAGVLQDRHGVLTAVYTGGATPLPDACALAQRKGQNYAGEAVVGNAPDPRAGKPEGRGVFRFPGRLLSPPKGILVQATPEPYLRLAGSEVRLIRFKLPKINGNQARRIRLGLPVVGEGKPRTLGSVRGKGMPKGIATFNVLTIPSSEGEEIFRLAEAKRAAYAIPLAKPKG